MRICGLSAALAAGASVCPADNSRPWLQPPAGCLRGRRSERQNVGVTESVWRAGLAFRPFGQGAGTGVGLGAGRATQGPSQAALPRKGRNPSVVARSGLPRTCDPSTRGRAWWNPSPGGGARASLAREVRRRLTRGSGWSRCPRRSQPEALALLPAPRLSLGLRSVLQSPPLGRGSASLGGSVTTERRGGALTGEQGFEK